MCVRSSKPSHHPRTSLQSLSDCSVQKWWRLKRVGIIKEQLRRPVASGCQMLPKAHVRLSPAATTTRKAQETLDSSASVDIEPLPTCTRTESRCFMFELYPITVLRTPLLTVVLILSHYTCRLGIYGTV